MLRLDKSKSAYGPLHTNVYGRRKNLQAPSKPVQYQILRTGLLCDVERAHLISVVFLSLRGNKRHILDREGRGGRKKMTFCQCTFTDNRVSWLAITSGSEHRDRHYEHSALFPATLK